MSGEEVKVKMSKKIKPENVKIFSPRRIVPIYLRTFHSLAGICFDDRKSVLNHFLFFIFLTRIISTTSFEIFYTQNHLHVKFVEFVVNLGIFLFPLVGFTYNYLFSNRMNQQIGLVLNGLRISGDELKPLYPLIRKLSLLWTLYCFILFVLNLLNGFSVFTNDNSWVIGKTFFVGVAVNPKIKRVVSVIVYVYEIIITNYIVLSLSLYLCYVRFLFFVKTLVLDNISRMNHQTGIIYLNRLDDLVDVFESFMSFLPFSWLSSCMVADATYIVTMFSPDSRLNENLYERTFACTYHSLNFFITISGLFTICKWQESVDRSVKLFTRSLQQPVYSQMNLLLIDRINEVVKRPVTVWSICPIDRSIILGYIGSTITFSTLFMQIQQNSV